VLSSKIASGKRLSLSLGPETHIPEASDACGYNLLFSLMLQRQRATFIIYITSLRKEVLQQPQKGENEWILMAHIIGTHRAAEVGKWFVLTEELWCLD
jgi:hypothetical protein